MTTVNIHKAKTHLSQLLQQVEAGEEVVISKYDRPVAKLIPFPIPQMSKRKPGRWEGKVWLSDDFYTCDKEIENLFYASEIFPKEK